jgi:hypothetical protein
VDGAVCCFLRSATQAQSVTVIRPNGGALYSPIILSTSTVLARRCVSILRLRPCFCVDLLPVCGSHHGNPLRLLMFCGRPTGLAPQPATWKRPNSVGPNALCSTWSASRSPPTGYAATPS